MAEPEIVLVIGAGASLADAANRAEVARPPLDRGFFKAALKRPPIAREIRLVESYLSKHYAIEDLRLPEVDSIEEVMKRIYSDIFDPMLGREAYAAFLRLLAVFNRRLAETTNEIDMTPRKLLYRVIKRLIQQAGHTKRLTIITFNQDIQVEKALAELQGRLPKRLGIPFAFPELYELANVTVTGPASGQRFETDGPSRGCVSLLKLHGSLNWYRTHRSANPEQRGLFKPDRKFEITDRRTIPLRLRRRRRSRMMNTFPVVIPPVSNKSAILPDMLRPVWREAEAMLATATNVVVFGYSCPLGDTESANLINKAFRRNGACEGLTVIDPNPAIVVRFAELTGMEKVSYFKNAKAFLSED